MLDRSLPRNHGDRSENAAVGCSVLDRTPWERNALPACDPAESLGDSRESGLGPIRRVLGDEAARLETQIDRQLQDQVADDLVPTTAAISRCRELARNMPLQVTRSRKVLIAAFIGDDSTVSLVVQSLLTDRRVNCKISQDGTSIYVLKTDERMTVRPEPLSHVDDNTMPRLALWVTSRQP